MQRIDWHRRLVLAGVLFLIPGLGAAQTIHTATDHIPNFAARPTIRSAASGAWSSPATWAPARVPGVTDVVSIAHTVVYDSMGGDVDVIGIDGGGVLRFAADEPTRLAVGTLVVLPNGTLEIGTAATPVAATVTAELIIKDQALNATADPDQFGTGLLAIDGRVTLHGAIKQPTFVRTVAEPLAGHTTVVVERPVTGWRVGDRLFLPDTRQVLVDHWFDPNWPLHVEERTITSISADGRTLTLSAALSFDHRGARDADGTPTVIGDGVRLLPHIGNLTRNVIIRSANPAGTRGHTLYTRRSDVKIAYVQFQDLGRTQALALDARTNHIGRYSLHIHHVWGPLNPANSGYQFTLIGNAVNDSLKWPMTVHGSHYGLIKQNVVFGGSQLTGAGIAVEDGSETENLFEENFVANIRGAIAPRQSGPGTADGTTAGSAAECFWGAGFNNRFVNNVAASCRNTVQEIVSGPGWKFVVPAEPYTARNPKFRGADMTKGNETLEVTPQYQAIGEFRGNEVYGLAADGLTMWQLGTDGHSVPSGMPETIVKDFRVWHTYEGAVYNYPAHRMTFDGLVYRVDADATRYWPAAVQCGDYRNIALTIRGGSIHAGAIFGNCTDPLGSYLVENVSAVTRDHAFQFDTPATPGTQARRPASGVQFVLRNNRLSPWPGQPLRTIAMGHSTAKGNSQPEGRYEVSVFDYQGQAGNNFRVYFDVQATQDLYGGRAPCGNSNLPEIRGITCPLPAGATTATRP